MATTNTYILDYFKRQKGFEDLADLFAKKTHSVSQAGSCNIANSHVDGPG